MEANKIIITGGATRIGAAIAKKLSGPNKEILIHYNKSKSKAESLRKELEKNGEKLEKDITGMRIADPNPFFKAIELQHITLKPTFHNITEPAYLRNFLWKMVRVFSI